MLNHRGYRSRKSSSAELLFDTREDASSAIVVGFCVAEPEVPSLGLHDRLQTCVRVCRCATSCIGRRGFGVPFGVQVQMSFEVHAENSMLRTGTCRSKPLFPVQRSEDWERVTATRLKLAAVTQARAHVAGEGRPLCKRFSLRRFSMNEPVRSVLGLRNAAGRIG